VVGVVRVVRVQTPSLQREVQKAVLLEALRSLYWSPPCSRCPPLCKGKRMMQPMILLILKAWTSASPALRGEAINCVKFGRNIYIIKLSKSG